MSIQPTIPPRADLELDEIQHLDFEPDCGHRAHDDPGPWPHGGPARVIVDSHCPTCPDGQAALLLCLPWWHYVLGPGFNYGECGRCGYRGTAAEFYTFRGWVKP